MDCWDVKGKKDVLIFPQHLPQYSENIKAFITTMICQAPGLTITPEYVDAADKYYLVDRQKKMTGEDFMLICVINNKLIKRRET